LFFVASEKVREMKCTVPVVSHALSSVIYINKDDETHTHCTDRKRDRHADRQTSVVQCAR